MPVGWTRGRRLPHISSAMSGPFGDGKPPKGCQSTAPAPATRSVYAFTSELEEWWRQRLQPPTPRAITSATPIGRALAPWLWVWVAAGLVGAGGVWYVSVRPGSRAAGSAPRISEGSARPPSVDPEAYGLYLRGCYHLTHRTGQMDRARQDLESAAERTPHFAPVFAALSDVYTRLARARPETGPDAWARADASAQRALALDATLPLAHVMAGTISLFRDHDWERSGAAFRRAVVLAPQDPDACNGYATWLRATGDLAGAIRQRQRALDADPVNVTLISRLAEDYVYARRYYDGIREYLKAVNLERDYRPAIDGLADAFARRGLTEQAGVCRVRLLTLRGERATADEFERLVRAKGYAAAERWLDRKHLEAYLQKSSANAWNLAFTYARLGEKEPAFRWLDEALARREGGVLQLRVDPDVDMLRADPRFQALLRRLGPAHGTSPLWATTRPAPEAVHPREHR
jgi:tetratricopeptide (TPR) repeat protein